MKKILTLAQLWLAMMAANAQEGLSIPAADSTNRTADWQNAMQENQAAIAKRQANQRKLETWIRKWIVGARIAPNLIVADNITDHSTGKYFSDAMGMGFDVYAGRFFTKTTGVRVGIGYMTAHNRVDNEWVSAWQFKHIYKGNGYYHYGVFEAYADALFDVGGTKNSSKFHPLHVYATVGVGVMAAGERKMDMKEMNPDDHDPKGSVAAWRMLKEYVLDEQGNIVIGKDGKPKKTGEYERFEYLVDTESNSNFELRMGLLFDYRFSKTVSANLELNVDLVNDRFDGIKYAEPFDIPIRLAAGVMLSF